MSKAQLFLTFLEDAYGDYGDVSSSPPPRKKSRGVGKFLGGAAVGASGVLAYGHHLASKYPVESELLRGAIQSGKSGFQKG